MRFKIKSAKENTENIVFLSLYEDSDGDIVLDVTTQSDERRTIVLFNSEGTIVYFPSSQDKEWFEKRGISVK